MVATALWLTGVLVLTGGFLLGILGVLLALMTATEFQEPAHWHREASPPRFHQVYYTKTIGESHE